MVKIIRRPLTDIYNRDMMTGKVVEVEPVEQEIWLKEKVDKWLKEKKKKTNKDWQIYVDWLGWVSL